MTMVNPKVLTSILPFGVVRKKNANEEKTFFRFSLCIDLGSDYSHDENGNAVESAPKEENLKEFLLYYGLNTERESVLAQIKKNIYVEINGKVIKCQPCFADIFNNEESYWKLLFKIDSVSGTTLSTLANSFPALEPFAGNMLTGKSVEPFPAVESKIFRNLVSNFEKRSLEADVKGISLEKDIKSIKDESEKISKEVEKVNNILEGISNFSAPQNDFQTNKLVKLRYNRNDTADPSCSVLASSNSILETFSFINSNTILQRLFGTTIDFEIDSVEFDQFKNHEFEIKIFPFNPETKAPTFDTFLTDANNANALQWQHFKTLMEYHNVEGKGSVILVKRNQTKKNYTPLNYDPGSKLKSLANLKEKIGDIETELKKAKTESERYQIQKELIAIDSAAFTRGLNIFDEDLASKISAHLENFAAVSANNTSLTEREVIKGYRFGVMSHNPDSTSINSIGSRSVEVRDISNNKINIPSEFETQEFAVNADTAMHALIKESGQTSHKLVIDTALVTWSGENIGMPSVFSNHEDETNFETNETEGSTSPSTDIVSKCFLRIFKEDYFPKSVHYHGKIQHGCDAVTLNDENNKDINKDITIQYRFNNNAKLLLGKVHKICILPEYKNGWGPSFNIKYTKDSSNKDISYELGYLDILELGDKPVEFKFKRNEPVKPICFYLQDPLLVENEKNDGNKLVKVQEVADKRDGESLHHLVIRNFNHLDDDQIHKTEQRSIRHILPPPISFEQALWHGKIFEIHTEYGTRESYRWYLKHHFPVNEGDIKLVNGAKVVLGKNDNGSEEYERYSYEESINGSTRMRDFYPDKWYVPDCWEKDDIINYLPDPLCKGFRFEFFLDKNYLIKARDYEKYEQNEYYFSGKYPYINAWKIIVEDIGGELVEFDNEEIYVRIEKGCELFVRSRTIIDESYEDQLETFGNYNDFTRYGNNDLLTPPLEFSIVHATQRPVVRPKINNTLMSAKDIGKTFLSLTNTVNLEQLNIYQDKAGIVRYLEDTLPTGNVELYAKWEEYSDDPNHQTVDDWTPETPVNKVNLTVFNHQKDESPAILEAVVDVANQREEMVSTLNRISNDRNEPKNYAVDLTANYDSRETKFIEKWFWIKNKSKFTSYYPRDWGTKDEIGKDDGIWTSKEYFNRTSAEPFLIKVLNNQKPTRPQLAARNIIPVSVVEDLQRGTSIRRKVSMNRLRFYFERGRLSSGKGERIGFVLNEHRSKYNNYLAANNLVSIVGKDIVSDSIKPYDGLYRNEDVLLNKSNFVVNDPYDLLSAQSETKADDLESFFPKYVEDLGLMTYLPKFDKNLNLWFLDVELDINDGNGNELHNPFMQFALVHYQENSVNYNKEGAELLNDCRISEIYKTGFVYLMGSRMFYIEKPSKSSLTVKIVADKTTIISQPTLKTRFFAFVEQKSSGGVKWTVVKKEDKREAFAEITINTSESVSLEYQRDYPGMEYRLTILETVYYGKEPNEVLSEFGEIHNNKNFRIVLVSTFNI